MVASALAPVAALLRRPLAWVAALSLLVNLLLLAPALFMLQLFDRVLSSRSQDTLLALLLGMGLALVFMLVLDLLRNRLQGVAGQLLADALAPRVACVLLARLAGAGERVPQEALRDVAALRNLFSAQGLVALLDLPWVAVYIAVIWLAHPWLGVAALGSGVALLVLALANDIATRQDIESVQVQAAHATRSLEASMQNAEVVQALGMAGAVLHRWQALNAACGAAQRSLAARSVPLAAATRSLRQAVQVLIPALGAWLVIAGETSPGVLVATTLLLGRALAPVEQVVGHWRVLAEGRLSLRRLSALLAEAGQEPQRMALPPPTGRLEAQSLVLRAPQGERLLLAGVSLQLAAGESLAIVGPSGAGKSTLVRLLTGLWQPSAGAVRLDGVDLAQWPRDAIGPWLGYVPQDVQLLAGTVAENIARMGPVDAGQVVEAARRAAVHDWVLSLPQGYDTPLQPGGTLLSPGQRQRLALARALYGQPRLLLLDEPNANLDADGEAALAATLQSLAGQVTVVVVTHRVALVRHVDKLLVLEAGRVRHFGPREEVLRAMNPRAAAGGAQVMPLPRQDGWPSPTTATAGSAA
ncbi:type I secretion system permease/ATPase [Ramlibacter tataouinensis]|uniref:type I secretion system permease/ATPase n=1 Tax=Ramlibacter tataouinensis TaxID=94132 RepID=UPI0022F38124|nr:type I secretion system permease/ATPase [Ramlibacter tataouinensis]WBY02420.1 type I secretion system permease/ATPase [Ramlibacter tataouinensis]